MLILLQLIYHRVSNIQIIRHKINIFPVKIYIHMTFHTPQLTQQTRYLMTISHFLWQRNQKISIALTQIYSSIISNIFYSQNINIQVWDIKMLSFVFGGASIILGLYILISHLFIKGELFPSSDVSYHLGCYDPALIFNHSDAISNKLMEITQDYEQSIKVGMYNSKALSPDFQNSITAIAQNFQNFLNQYYKIKSKSAHDVQYHNTLHLAFRQSKQCEEEIKKSFSEQDCLSTWENYQNLIKQYESIKQGITLNLNHKESLEQQLAAMVISQNYEDADEIYEKFNLQINELEKQLALQEIEMNEAKGKRKKLTDEVRYLSDDISQLQNFLQQCNQNQRQITYCQKISKEIKKLGNQSKSLSKEQLSKRIAQKKKIIQSLQATLKKLRKVGSSQQVKDIMKDLDRQRIEVKLLEAQITSFTTSEEAKCQMCSDQRLQQLKNNITILSQRRTNLEAELVKVIDLQGQKTQLIKQLKKKINQLENDREADLNAKFCIDDACKKEQKSKIQKLSQSLNAIKIEIIDKKIELKEIQDQIYRMRKEIQKTLPNIDRINQCVKKRELYESIRNNQPQKTESVSQELLEAKARIIGELEGL